MRLILLFILLVMVATPAMAGFDPIDGTYDAHVATGTQIYRVSVEVTQGKVAAIIWPNGARLTLNESRLIPNGARIRDGKSTGHNAQGISFVIHIDNLEYKYDDSDEFEFRDRTDKNIGLKGYYRAIWK